MSEPLVLRTPQHNATVERKIRDERSVSGLRSWTRLESIAEAARRFERAIAVLDHQRLRAKYGHRTAADRDPERTGALQLRPNARPSGWTCAPRRKTPSDAVRGRVTGREPSGMRL